MKNGAMGSTGLLAAADWLDPLEQHVRAADSAGAARAGSHRGARRSAARTRRGGDADSILVSEARRQATAADYIAEMIGCRRMRWLGSSCAGDRVWPRRAAYIILHATALPETD